MGKKSDDKKGYVLYKTWSPMIRELPDAEAGQLFKAIARFQDGEQDTYIDNPILNGIFEMMKTTFQDDSAKYEETCRKRSAAGKKGGRPSKSKNENQKKPKETNCFFRKAKKADIDKDIDKDIDLDINNNIINDVVCMEPLASSMPAIELNDGSEWFPKVSDVEEWSKLYPGIDVKTELGRMRQWCKSNPTKRKTKKGVRRFVQTWLDREQNRSRGKQAGSGNKFNQFEQNQYDFDQLEKDIVAN